MDRDWASAGGAWRLLHHQRPVSSPHRVRAGEAGETQSPSSPGFASIIYNHRPGTHDVSASGETAMPQVSQPAKGNQNYGRPIPEIQPEEVHTETIQGRQRRAEEKTGRGREVSRRQEPLAGLPLLSLLMQKSGEQIPARRIECVLVKREILPCALVSFALRFHLPGDHDELSSN